MFMILKLPLTHIKATEFVLIQSDSIDKEYWISGSDDNGFFIDNTVYYISSLKGLHRF